MTPYHLKPQARGSVDRCVLRSAAKGEPHPTSTSELTRELKHSSGSLGAAYFDPVRCVIRVLEDTLETSHFDSTNMRESMVDCLGNISELIYTSPGTGGAGPYSDYKEDGR